MYIEQKDKISTVEVVEFFRAATGVYTDAALKVGLWESEKIFAEKYFPKNEALFDMGCGAGRTSFGLQVIGYSNITAGDVTPSMVHSAIQLNNQLNCNINFVVCDATQLEYADCSFQSVLFSFNGLMQIPGMANRIKAMKEIHRVLKKGGHFIFTSHDRDMEFKFQNYWKAEKESWDSGSNDPSLHEFGDRIVRTRHEKAGIFIHHPDRAEILECIRQSGFTLVEDVFRSELVDESEIVKNFSGDCRFWVLLK